jgi:hypothetical protein
MAPSKTFSTAKTTLVSSVVTLLLAATVTVVSGAWASKESVSAHSADIRAIDAKLERLLDAYCENNPKRACTAPPITTSTGAIVP